MMTPNEIIKKYNIALGDVVFVEEVKEEAEYASKRSSYKFRFELYAYAREYNWGDVEDNAPPQKLYNSHEADWTGDWTYTVGAGILLNDENGNPLPPSWVGGPTKKDALQYMHPWGKKLMHQKESFDTYVMLRTQNKKYLFRPQIEDILHSLYCDFSSLENARGFESWAEETGYDSDSRKAEAIYNTIVRHVASFKFDFGKDLYEDLVENTDWSNF